MNRLTGCALILFSVVFTAQAAGQGYGLTVGMSASKFTGDDRYWSGSDPWGAQGIEPGRMFGVVLGGLAEVPLNRSRTVCLRSELAYIGKGARYEGDDGESVTVNLDYLYIGAYLKFALSRAEVHPVFVLGYEGNIKLSENVPPTDNELFTFRGNPGPISISAGFGIEVYRNEAGWVDGVWSIEARYHVDVENAAKFENTDIKSNSIVLALRYRWLHKPKTPDF